LIPSTSAHALIGLGYSTSFAIITALASDALPFAFDIVTNLSYLEVSYPRQIYIVAMAPKHGLSALQAEEQLAKRAKNSETPGSRSATPADQTGKVPFEVKYPVMNSKKKLTRKEQELVDNADFQVSPFISQYPAKDGELDQHYTVVPSEEWDSMKKYNNFISEWL
jgi:hypothetical protein